MGRAGWRRFYPIQRTARRHPEAWSAEAGGLTLSATCRGNLVCTRRPVHVPPPRLRSESRASQEVILSLYLMLFRNRVREQHDRRWPPVPKCTLRNNSATTIGLNSDNGGMRRGYQLEIPTSFLCSTVYASLVYNSTRRVLASLLNASSTSTRLALSRTPLCQVSPN